MAENGSLYLVTGCDKTVSWGLASFSNSSGGNDMSLKATAAQIASGNASCSYTWETTSPATVHSGPYHLPQEQRLQNQCVFVRGFRISIRSGTLAKFRGPLKLSPVPKGDSSRLFGPFNRMNRHVPFTDIGSSASFWRGLGWGGGNQRTISSGEFNGKNAEDDVFVETIDGSHEVLSTKIISCRR